MPVFPYLFTIFKNTINPLHLKNKVFNQIKFSITNQPKNRSIFTASIGDVKIKIK